MTGLEIFLICCVVLLLVVIGFGVKYGAAAGRRIRAWETLFEETYEEMKNAEEIFHSLVYRRQLLLDDPEIQRLIKVFEYTFNVLEIFLRNGEQLVKTTKEKKEEGV